MTFLFDPQALGERINDFLAEYDLEQNDLAPVLGVSTSYVSCLVRGVRTPSYHVLDKLCQYFATTPNYLLYGLESDKYCSYKQEL